MSANSFIMQQSLASASQPRQSDTLITWITCLFVAAMFALAWVGYVGGDDDIYSEAAMRFLQEGFFVGESHFEVRHPVIISIALSYALFGIGVMQLALVSAAYGAGTLLLMFLMLKSFGTRTACLGVALLSSLPLFAIQASITYCDMVEVFFVVLSVFLFIKSIDSPNQVAWLIIAGIITAVAFLSRTTTIGLLAGYGVLFLLGQGPKRSNYWWMAGGFLLIVMIDTLLLFSATGDPVYRLTLAWDNVVGEDVTLITTTGLMVPDQSGNISILPLLDPILLFFINHEFGILFFFALPAAIWALFIRAKDNSGTALLKWLIIIGLAWAVVSTIALNKYSHPRYFIVTSICFIFPLSVWLQEVAFKKFKFIATGILLLLLAANFTGIYLDNKKPLSGEYQLRDYALTSAEPIYTDPYTADRASFLLEIENIDEKVFHAPAPSGSLYLYNPNRLDKIDFADVEHFRPNENWQLIYRSETSRKLSGIVLEALGLSDYIPESIFKRLDSPWQPIEVYRVKN